jgi:hypothetical protein
MLQQQSQVGSVSRKSTKTKQAWKRINQLRRIEGATQNGLNGAPDWW